MLDLSLEQSMIPGFAYALVTGPNATMNHNEDKEVEIAHIVTLDKLTYNSL